MSRCTQMPPATLELSGSIVFARIQPSWPEEPIPAHSGPTPGPFGPEMGLFGSEGPVRARRAHRAHRARRALWARRGALWASRTEFSGKLKWCPVVHTLEQEQREKRQLEEQFEVRLRQAQASRPRR